jgi:hypothetical protein
LFICLRAWFYGLSLFCGDAWNILQESISDAKSSQNSPESSTRKRGVEFLGACKIEHALKLLLIKLITLITLITLELYSSFASYRTLKAYKYRLRITVD